MRLSSHEKTFSVGVIITLVLCALTYFYYHPITDYQKGYVEAIGTVATAALIVLFFYRLAKKFRSLTDKDYKQDDHLENHDERLCELERRAKIKSPERRRYHLD
jgi:Ca2+/Na+ antiporter